MQTPEQRDEKTIVIATALGLFCLVLVVGAIGTWAVVSLMGLSDSSMASKAIALAAGATLVAYLVHTRRR